LGPALQAQLAGIVGVYEYPNNGIGTGGQETGWHVWMEKDLRSVLGEHVRGPFAVRYCGAGNLKRCARLLWAAIDAAGNELASQQGPNPAGWHQSATAEEITFVPGLLPYRMRYTNRPTGIQQVLSFFGHAPEHKGR
jgi:hypothetical protein